MKKRTILSPDGTEREYIFFEIEFNNYIKYYIQGGIVWDLLL